MVSTPSTENLNHRPSTASMIVDLQAVEERKAVVEVQLLDVKASEARLQAQISVALGELSGLQADLDGIDRHRQNVLARTTAAKNGLSR